MSKTFTTKHGLVFTQFEIDPEYPDLVMWSHALMGSRTQHGYISVHLRDDEVTAAFGVSHENDLSIECEGLSALEAANLVVDAMIDNGLITTPTPA